MSKAIRVTIAEDERYPFFHFTDTPQWGESADVDAEVADKWRRVLAEFETVQDEMQEAFNVAKSAAEKAKKIAAAEKAVAEAEAKLRAARGDA